jgi:hypothetical protein
MTSTPKDQQKQSRDRRLAAALRDNLKRRKAQARARQPERDQPTGRGEARSKDMESHDSAGIIEHKS